MDNTGTGYKQSNIVTDSIDTLKNDIKCVELQRQGNIREEQLKEFFDRLEKLVKELCVDVDAFIKETNEGSIEKSNDNYKQRRQIDKRLIFWNLLALLLFWAEVDIGSQANSGAVFGIVVSGLDGHEIVVGYLIFLLILYARWLWVSIKTSITFINIYTLSVNNIKKRLNDHELVYERLMKQSIARSNGYDASIKRQLDHVAEIISGRDLMSNIELYICICLCPVLTFVTVVTIIFCHGYYNSYFVLRLCIVLISVVLASAPWLFNSLKKQKRL